MNMDTKRVVLLMPRTPWKRFREDGLMDCMEEHGIDCSIKTYQKLPHSIAIKVLEFILNPVPDCVVYPRFTQCEVWHWHGASRDWFFGWDSGRLVLEPKNGEDLVGGAGLLRMIEERGVKLVPMDFYYGGHFDDFEITFYGKPEDFVAELLKQTLFHDR